MRSAERVARLGALTIAVWASAACGGAAGGTSVAAVQDTTYTCKGDRVFDAAVKAVEKEFKGTRMKDAAQGSVIAETQWFDASGGPRVEADLVDGDIAVVARLQITDLKPNYKFVVDAVVKRRVGEDPEPRDLTGPPPAWVQTKLDNVTLEMHRQLESCAMLAREPH